MALKCCRLNYAIALRETQVGENNLEKEDLSPNAFTISASISRFCFKKNESTF